MQMLCTGDHFVKHFHQHKTKQMKKISIQLAVTFFLSSALALGSMHASAQADSLKKVQKIEELFKVINMEDACLQSAKAAAEGTIKNSPALAGKEEQTLAFFTKHMGYANMKTALINTYAKYYTTDEIEELTRFYQTPAGKKFNQVMGNIAAETVAISTQNLNLNAAELNKLAKPDKN